MKKRVIVILLIVCLLAGLAVLGLKLSEKAGPPVSEANGRNAAQLLADLVSAVETPEAGDDERIRRALAIACADEFVDDIDAVLGERGSGLSEGQMQRISIARAIFSEAPILLLDEATSALDDQTEQKLLENLRNLTDRTVVIVTHRSAALSVCNRILRFTEGGVTE